MLKSTLTMMKSNLNKLKVANLFFVFLTINSFAQINFPTKVTPYHYSDLYNNARRSGLYGSKSYLKKFLQIGIADYKEYKDLLPKVNRFLIKEIHKRVKLLITETDKKVKDNLIFEIVELTSFYRKSKLRSGGPFPNHVYFQRVAHRYLKTLSYNREYDPKRKVAIFAPNLVDDTGEFIPLEKLKTLKDRDKFDPKPSAFWNKVDVDNYEIFHYAWDDKRDFLCNKDQIFYFRKVKKRPEEGGGYNPGVKAYLLDEKGEQIRVTLKFQVVREQGTDTAPFFSPSEAVYEPGTAQLYRMFGLNSDRGFFCPSIKIKFTHQLLELSTSKRVDRLLWNFKNYYKNFQLDDGSIVPFNRIFKVSSFTDFSTTSPDLPFGVPSNEYTLNEEYAGRLEYIITAGVYMEFRPRKVERVSRWIKHQLSHPDRREIRGASLLDAWVGNIDNLGHNLKGIFIKKKKKLSKMKFYFVDAGAVFKKRSWITSDLLGYLPNELAAPMRDQDYDRYLEVMEPYKVKSELEIFLNQFSHEMIDEEIIEKPIAWDLLSETEKMAKFIEDIDYFDDKFSYLLSMRATFEDLRWATRKIAAISEENILKAMCLTGLGFPGAVLQTEKLIARRDQLIKYFDLEDEIPLLRPNGPNKLLTIEGEGQITVKHHSGEERSITIPSNGHYVKNGVYYTNNE